MNCIKLTFHALENRRFFISDTSIHLLSIKHFFKIFKKFQNCICAWHTDYYLYLWDFFYSCFYRKSESFTLYFHKTYLLCAKCDCLDYNYILLELWYISTITIIHHIRNLKRCLLYYMYSVLQRQSINFDIVCHLCLDNSY